MSPIGERVKRSFDFVFVLKRQQVKMLKSIARCSSILDEVESSSPGLEYTDTMVVRGRKMRKFPEINFCN